jgi:flagellar biosynthesis GTPase FlhF
MKVIPFIADDVATALAQIHQQLGPDAVVLSVRPLPVNGLARIWRRTRSVEVLACIPAEEAQTVQAFPRTAIASESNRPLSGKWSSPARVAPALHDDTGRPHVFVGPPGVGKTTLLCKWLAYSVLNENRSARVWRLDGDVANTAEFLNIYGEMLGVPVERFWTGSPSRADLLLVDWPGIPADNPQALRTLSDLLSLLPAPRVHLVLNGAYESSILLAQFRAFAPLQPEDVSLCHLDEETRHGKLHDFLSGTNCSLRFLSTGQKIPGDFLIVDPNPTPNLGFPEETPTEAAPPPWQSLCLTPTR